ncbi:PQQ-dependent sugar dehydrogenase [Bradyrhizobium semiaridum]|uniref:PQQ-dependent sugar dehydrogenase n=1 Tax=Bradyrhizobium semiaridum TaxID=2821404 RepID=UPI001CE37874|nr:PQQ-dependent sugar dehydrogenase [Bradyrhizobium semiaridum]
MPNANVVLGNDGINDLSGSAGRDLIYGFDPNGAQGNVGSITATRVATGLTGALYATAAPGDSGRLFVVQQNGTVRIVDLVTGQLLPTPFLTANVDANGERGLLGLAFDPDYATNGFVYAYMTVTTGGAHNEIVRYHVNPANPNTVDGMTTVMSLGNLSSATNHNGGWIGFGPDGYLYAAVGDNANGNNAQTAANLFGKIVRIDVHADAFPADPNKNYAIPSDNMFVGTVGAAAEIFALGLRNPFRDSFDRGTGEFYIADVGASSWEEIDIGRGGRLHAALRRQRLGCDRPDVADPYRRRRHLVPDLVRRGCQGQSLHRHQWRRRVPADAGGGLGRPGRPVARPWRRRHDVWRLGQRSPRWRHR